jgi:hypothetical protein
VSKILKIGNKTHVYIYILDVHAQFDEKLTCLMGYVKKYVKRLTLAPIFIFLTYDTQKVDVN